MYDLLTLHIVKTALQSRKNPASPATDVFRTAAARAEDRVWSTEPPRRTSDDRGPASARSRRAGGRVLLCRRSSLDHVRLQPWRGRVQVDRHRRRLGQPTHPGRAVVRVGPGRVEVGELVNCRYADRAVLCCLKISNHDSLPSSD